MKLFCLLLIFNCAFFICTAQTTPTKISVADTTKKVELVDAACGQCRFGLPGKGCNLAIRTGGKAYFVDGTSIDEHGDAHASDGFCNAIREAQVQGKIVGNRFNATYFKLVKVEATKD